MEFPVHCAKILIKEHHLDTLGHVNNATYISLFEQVRWDLMSDGGFGLEQIKKSQHGPVILAIEIKYLREILNREEVLVETQVLDYSSKVGALKQRMIKTSGEVASEAKVSFALMDLKERKLIAPTDEWLKALGVVL